MRRYNRNPTASRFVVPVPYYYGCPKSYVRACTAPINEDAREWRTKILGEAEVEER